MKTHAEKPARDFRLDRFEVRPSLREVVSPEGSVTVEARSMDVLVVLAERAGEVVSRDELLNAVWGEQFVTEEILTHAIWDLRRALGDDPKSSRFIQTVPKRGYRLTAKVSWLEQGVGETARYRLIERLGGGAMGVVFKAEDTRLRRTVALKFLPAEWSRDADAKRRFMREARAASALDHPNICTVHDIDETEDGRLFIAMAFYEGETLKSKVARGPLPVEEAINVAAQVAEGLAAAHRQGMVHRDIKPANVLVTRDGVAKIVDFGLAKLAGQTRITRTGSSLGTPAYMSPEQARGAEVDRRTDLWSLGVVLYKLVTGRLPFRGDSEQAVIYSILNEEPEPLAALRPDRPDGLEEILDRLLEKDSSKRYAEAEALVADLRRIHPADGAATELPPRRPAAGRLRIFGVRWLWLVAALMSIAIGIAGWQFRSSSTPADPPPGAVPLTSLPGMEVWPALSPSGDRVAFVWNGGGDGRFHLYVKLVGGGDAVQLTEHLADDYSPTWSPDGQEIAFLRTVKAGHRGGGESDVLTIPALGGSERRLGTISTSDLPDAGWFPRVAWSPDDRYLAVVDRALPREPMGIFLITIETGEKRRLTAPPPGSFRAETQPAFSPDGTTLAFVGNGSEIYLRSLAGGEPELLGVEADRLIINLDWVPDGSAIVYCSGSEAEAGTDLRRIPVSGGTPTRLPYGAMAQTFSIARQGARLVYDQPPWPDSDLWRIDGPSSEERGPPTRLTSASRMDWAQAFSPDGARIAFTSERAGAPNIWLCESDGTECTQLTRMERAIWPRWSPDGTSIVFAGQHEGHYGLHVVDVQGRFTRRLEISMDRIRGGSWSHDGRWIYFSANPSGEGQQVWKIPAQGGQPIQITRKGGWVPQESADGEFLYYSDPAGGMECTIRRVPVDGGQELPITGAQKIDCVSWALWGNGLIYRTWDGGRAHLERLDLETRQVTRFNSFEQPGGDYSTNLTVSPDGRWVVVSLNAPKTSDLMLVEDFR